MSETLDLYKSTSTSEQVVLTEEPPPPPPQSPPQSQKTAEENQMRISGSEEASFHQDNSSLVEDSSDTELSDTNTTFQCWKNNICSSDSFTKSSSSLTDISRSPSPAKRMSTQESKIQRIRSSFSTSRREFLKISSIYSTGYKAATPIAEHHTLSYSESYTTLEKIGAGAQGEVYRCRSIQSPGRSYAVKMVKFKDGENLLNISREFYLLESLRHPNLIRSHDFFVSAQKCYIILDYLHGFSLLELLEVKQPLITERQTKYIVSETTKGIKYLHEHGVCHRDITRGNIFVDQRTNAVKLIDFSNSRSFTVSHQRMMTKTGTITYMAPEIFNESNYSAQVDMWSLGIVTYSLLTLGELPYESVENDVALINEIIHKEFNLTHSNPHLAHLPQIAIDFLAGLLNRDPFKRLTPSQALSHAWLKHVDIMCDFREVFDIAVSPRKSSTAAGRKSKTSIRKHSLLSHKAASQQCSSFTLESLDALDNPATITSGNQLQAETSSSNISEQQKEGEKEVNYVSFPLVKSESGSQYSMSLSQQQQQQQIRCKNSYEISDTNFNNKPSEDESISAIENRKRSRSSRNFIATYTLMH